MNDTFAEKTSPAGQPTEHDPASSLHHPVAQPIAWPHLHPARQHSDGVAQPDNAGTHNAAILHHSHPLHQIKTSLQVCVGAAQITIGALLAAQVGDVLGLDRAVDQAVDLLLNGQVVARGQLIAVDDFFAVRITELPLPLNLPAQP